MPLPADQLEINQQKGMRWGDPGGLGVDAAYFESGYLKINTQNGLQVLAGAVYVQGGSQISFMNGTVEEVRLFHGALGTDGALTLYSYVNNTRSALDIGPTRGTLPTANAYSELTLYRTIDQGTNFERISLSAMASPNAFYLEVEAGGTGAFRDTRFLFVPNTVTTWVATPVGSSYPFAFDRGHIRFDTDNMQGAAGTPWIGREGGGALTINTPTGQAIAFKVNNVTSMAVLTNQVSIGIGTPVGTTTLHLKTTQANVNQSFTVAGPNVLADGVTLNAINDTNAANKGLELRASTCQITATNIQLAGSILAATDNTYDIGSTGALRPRTAYLAGAVAQQGAFATNIGVQLNGGAFLYSGSGVPANATGNNGDVYFRIDGGAGTTIYQRRAGSWVATAA